MIYQKNLCSVTAVIKCVSKYFDYNVTRFLSLFLHTLRHIVYFLQEISVRKILTPEGTLSVHFVLDPALC